MKRMNYIQTFFDEKTGRMIESTWLARALGKLSLFSVLGITLGLIFGLVLGTLKGFGISLVESIAVSIAIGAIASLVTNLLVCFHDVNGYQLVRVTHNGIARWQDSWLREFCRRQQLEEEWAGVPEKALSRAKPSRPPQVTDVSLSQANPPEEEKKRLAGAVEEEQSTGLEIPVKIR